MPARRLLALAAIAAVLAAGCARPPTGREGGSEAAAKPGGVRARFDGFAGGPAFMLPDDLGGRPLVVNFWASWCVPCRQEMPAFQSVYQRARGTVGFLGVDYLDEVGAARRLVADTGVTYRLAADPKGSEASKLGVTGLPTTLFFSADGVLRGRRLGAMDADALRAAIRTYLGQQVS